MRFSLWEKPYQQPPYKTGDNYLPMLIMAYGDIECGKDFDSVGNTSTAKYIM